MSENKPGLLSTKSSLNELKSIDNGGELRLQKSQPAGGCANWKRSTKCSCQRFHQHLANAPIAGYLPQRLTTIIHYKEWKAPTESL